MMVPQTVVYFTVYDQLKTRFGLVEGQQNYVAPMLAGMSARGMFPVIEKREYTTAGIFYFSKTNFVAS